MMDVLQIAMFALLPLMAAAIGIGLKDIGRTLRELPPVPENNPNALSIKEFSWAA